MGPVVIFGRAILRSTARPGTVRISPSCGLCFTSLRTATGAAAVINACRPEAEPWAVAMF